MCCWTNDFGVWCQTASRVSRDSIILLATATVYHPERILIHISDLCGLPRSWGCGKPTGQFCKGGLEPICDGENQRKSVKKKEQLVPVR